MPRRAPSRDPSAAACGSAPSGRTVRGASRAASHDAAPHAPGKRHARDGVHSGPRAAGTRASTRGACAPLALPRIS
ncbi:hypothetical protein AQ938_19190 [Burkholderia pseudomallei]|nr:hypothetical protein AMS56_13665 [Burkholderia pseudomallei]ARK98469.1 hypothetical protein BOC43_30225 [Burkholderia pseudomallei]ARL37954.1 hypothetical protein BOC49_18400 [Burkholderia pseudomallei]OAB09226.1 hypothetical protein AQ841_29990 [Burkholderia pseudomallei]OMR78200.1 hypothetical protein AQ729_23440 [Burkholderia pseudomallei]